MDTKATVPVGESSRGGRSRGRIAVEAWDHDRRPKETLVPGGILEPVTGRSFLFFGRRNTTSDFMVAGLLQWWEERQSALSLGTPLVIHLENGPACSGRRSQCLLRMTECADVTGLSIRIVDSPPEHSQYNGIKRYWAGLEQSWNGYLLDRVTTVLHRASNCMWTGMRTTARLLGTAYEKGVTVCGQEKPALEVRLQRDPKLQWWDVRINPKMV